ncbi:MAG: hypothetical protein R8L07_07335 [Alphaproteobacteria bacterium]|nr:hypothetical protein [Alphaproteobacteria bacterium]
MPLPYKIALSLIVALVAALVGWLETQGPQPHLATFVYAIAGIMLFGLWVFPEAGGGKPERKK